MLSSSPRGDSPYPAHRERWRAVDRSVLGKEVCVLSLPFIAAISLLHVQRICRDLLLVVLLREVYSRHSDVSVQCNRRMYRSQASLCVVLCGVRSSGPLAKRGRTSCGLLRSCIFSP